jgi:hypothetical protein
MKASGIKKQTVKPQSLRELRTDHPAFLRDPRLAALMSDDGVAEALRANAEMDSDPSIGISLEEFEKRIRVRLLTVIPAKAGIQSA